MEKARGRSVLGCSSVPGAQEEDKVVGDEGRKVRQYCLSMYVSE